MTVAPRACIMGVVKKVRLIGNTDRSGGLTVIRSRPTQKLFAALPPWAIGRPKAGRAASRQAAPAVTPGTVRVRGGIRGLPLPAPIPAGQVWAAGRQRLLTTLSHIEGPVVWRLAAHAAVLVLTLGVVATPFLSGDRPVVASARPNFLRSDWTDRAIAFVPDSIVGAEAQSIAAAEVRPGFDLPGAIVEAKSSLLPWTKPEVYTVTGGDSLASIADRFGIQPIWLMYTNAEPAPDSLSPQSRHDSGHPANEGRGPCGQGRRFGGLVGAEVPLRPGQGAGIQGQWPGRRWPAHGWDVLGDSGR